MTDCRDWSLMNSPDFGAGALVNGVVYLLSQGVLVMWQGEKAVGVWG